MIDVTPEMRYAGMVALIEGARERQISIPPMTAERLAVATYRAMERKRRQYEVIAGQMVPKDE